MPTIQKRTAEDGKISYRAMVRLKGHPKVSKTFKRKTDAEKWAQATESAMRERRYFKTAESEKHTVANMIDRYLTILKRDNPRRYKDVHSMLSWWRGELGYCVLADLTRSMITNSIEKVSERTKKSKLKGVHAISPARVNRYIAAFSHVCTMAVRDWEWLEIHPMQKITRKKEPRGRVRFLDDDERGKLLKACRDSKNPYLYTIVILALSTGARYSEILNIKWGDVDLDRACIVLHDTKNKERRNLPLAGHALELMLAHANSFIMTREGYVFPSPHDAQRPYDVRTAWDHALKVAEISDFRFHDLRHSAASYLAMNGATLAEIAEVLGHKTLQMVKRYAHLSESHTRSVVASMNQKIFGEE